MGTQIRPVGINYDTDGYSTTTSRCFAFSMVGNIGYEIRLAGSGSGIERITCMASHWTGSYALYKEAFLGFDSYGGLQNHQMHEATSGTQGAWSYSRPQSGETGYQSHLIITKSAGSYQGGMTGIIILDGHHNWTLSSVTTL